MKPFIKKNYMKIMKVGVGTSIFTFNFCNYNKSPINPLLSPTLKDTYILPMCLAKGLVYGSFPHIGLLTLISSPFYGDINNHLIPYNSYKIKVDDTGTTFEKEILDLEFADGHFNLKSKIELK